jgi:hypothetical protein
MVPSTPEFDSERLALQQPLDFERDFPLNSTQTHALKSCVPRRGPRGGGMDFAKLSSVCGVIAHLIGVLRTHA